MSVLVLPSHRPPLDPGPRADFLLLAERLGGRVLYPARTGAAGSAEARVGADVRQALAAARARDTALYVSLSERVGLPLALLLRRRRGKDRAAPHVLVAHRLTSRAKRFLHGKTGVFGDFARIVVLCHAQARAAIEEYGVPPPRVVRLWDAVDTAWWSAADSLPRAPAAPPIVVSVGREGRDFVTLLAALRTLPEVRGVLVTGSPWSRAGSADLPPLPAGVETRSGLPASELRALYARASVAVVPLRPDCAHAAGSNALLEAMAAGLPVVATRTPGLADYLWDGTNCRAVCAAGSPGALADVVRDTLRDGRALGARAAGLARVGFSLERYVRDLERVAREALAER